MQNNSIQNRKDTYKYNATFENTCGRAESISFEVEIDGSYNYPSTMIKESFSSTDKYGVYSNGSPILSDIDKFRYYPSGHILFIEEKQNLRLFNSETEVKKRNALLRNGKASICYVEVPNYLKDDTANIKLFLFNGLELRFIGVECNKIVPLCDLLLNGANPYLYYLEGYKMNGTKRILTYDSDTDTFEFNMPLYIKAGAIDLTGYTATMEDTEALEGLLNALSELVKELNNYAE